VLVRQLLGRDAELAGRAVDGIHARIDLGQALRIELDLVDVVVQRVHRFLQLDARRLHAVEHGLQAGVDVGQLGQLLVQRGQLRQDRLLRFRQRIQGFLRSFDQAGRMRQAAVLVDDLDPFAVLHRQLVQFADLPFEALAFQHHVLGIGLEFLALARQRLPGLVAAGDMPHLFDGARIAHGDLVVQQGALGIALHQRLVRVLAVDVDQQLAQFAQLAGGGGDAVDVGLGAAGIVDHPAQQRTALVVLELVLFCSQMLAAWVSAKSALMSALAAPSRTMLASPRPPSASWSASIRIDLPAPVSPVKHREAVRELELDRVDDDEVADGQCAQHEETHLPGWLGFT
jgi:hypothetical protein